MLHAARCKYRTQKSRQKSPSGHHRITLSGYIFATKASIDNRKKDLFSSNISSTCPHNMVNFSALAAEIVSLVWHTPGNFNGFRVLAALLHGTLAVGVSQTLRRSTEGATYIRQGGYHVRHWPTFLVGYCFVTRRRSAISLSCASTSCCFSSALLNRALAFVTNGNSPFSHTSHTIPLKWTRGKKRPSSIVCVCPLIHV